MKTAGIIAEYNPFHNGHAFHISETRRATGADRVIAVMSGSFVQRGEPACADKFTRASWAISGGADMVIELPDVYSLSCAERFASGAMRILKGTGLVDCICFGSESGDIEDLTEKAEAETDGSAFDKAIGSGLSYPGALAEATGSSPSPNDILGIEYIRANRNRSCGFGMYTVKRDSDYNSSDLGGEYSSAYAIRLALSGDMASRRISPAVFDGLERALPRNELDEILDMVRGGRFPASAENLSDAVLYKFRSMTRDDIACLPEVSEGLENLYKRYSEECGDHTEMLGRIKSKRYTMARLKRIAMCGLLGISKELQDRAFTDDSGLYARVLAVREGSQSILSELKEKADIPVIVRYSDREELADLGKEIERISAFAHAVRALGQPYEKSYVPDGSNKLVIK
ncbi:MAG: nucleotidyltransferase family protein [Clostridiales bacterium]|nr:nucleotidyltransferase family protein [Clostridiales bacterium]